MAQGAALIVKKEKIAANGEYNLSGERYRTGNSIHSEWPSVKVGDVFKKANETVLPSSLHGSVSYVGLENITAVSGQLSGNVTVDNPAEIKSLKNVFHPGDILYGKLRPNLNKVWLSDRRGICSTDIFVVRPLDERVLPALYVYIFRSRHFNDTVLSQLKGAQLPRIGWQSFANLEIPLPPLEVQREIVAEIESHQRVVDGARTVIDNYQPQIVVDPEWPRVKIEELCETGRGRVISRRNLNNNPGPYPVYSSQTSDDGIFGCLGTYDFDGEYVTWTTDGANAGTVFHRMGKFNCTNVCGTLKCRADAMNRIDMRFLAQVLGQVAKSYVIRVGNPKLMNKEVAKIPISVPPIEIQQVIVAELEAEQALVAANRELVGRMERKIRAAIGRVWGEDEVKDG